MNQPDGKTAEPAGKSAYFDVGRVEAHYSPPDLTATILRALAQAGKNPDRLSAEDLAPIDEFHVRGRQATLELARRLELAPGTRVLDVGSGLGGPSRCLAADFGCQVIGVDLSGEYCRAATLLARCLGLESRVCYRQGNALNLPFEGRSFDVVWTQHTAMNIPDKAAFYREIRRVLKPDGVLALYDILAGPGGAAHFPAPWAREPATSFLIKPEELRSMVEAVGFQILSWRDVTEAGRSWFRKLGERLGQRGIPSIGIHLLLGDDYRTMAENQVLNLEEGRIVLIEAVLRAPKD